MCLPTLKAETIEQSPPEHVKRIKSIISLQYLRICLIRTILNHTAYIITLLNRDYITVCLPIKPYKFKQIFEFKEKVDGLRESQLEFYEKWNKGIRGESFT